MGTHPIFESDFDCLTEWVRGPPSHSRVPGLPRDGFRTYGTQSKSHHVCAKSQGTRKRAKNRATAKSPSDNYHAKVRRYRNRALSSPCQTPTKTETNRRPNTRGARGATLVARPSAISHAK